MYDDVSFFINKECKKYPCHDDIPGINCIFCFCPLYNFDCLGIYKIIDKIKDCSKCSFPHQNQNLKLLIEKIKLNLQKKDE